MISIRAFIAGLVFLAQPAGAAAGVFCHGEDRAEAGHGTAPATPGTSSVTEMATYAGCQSVLACREQFPLVPAPPGGNDLPRIPSLKVAPSLPSLVSVIADGPPTPPPNG
jgi:hypothetical protein